MFDIAPRYAHRHHACTCYFPLVAIRLQSLSRSKRKKLRRGRATHHPKRQHPKRQRLILRPREAQQRRQQRRRRLSRRVKCSLISTTSTRLQKRQRGPISRHTGQRTVREYRLDTLIATSSLPRSEVSLGCKQLSPTAQLLHTCMGDPSLRAMPRVVFAVGCCCGDVARVLSYIS